MTSIVPFSSYTHSPIPGPKIILEGPPGSGKTTAIKTAADAGLEVFVLFTDPGMEVISSDPRIKWTYIPPATSPWGSLINTANIINTMNNKSLQDMTSIEPSQCRQFIDVLRCMNDFTVGGKSYGDVSTWGTGRLLVIDGLSGLSKQSRQLAVGTKPILSQPDWGVAMNNLSTFVDKIACDLWCPLVLISHVEMERDEVSGGLKGMPSTLGRKLAPVLPVNFSDVILASASAGKFEWSTANHQFDLKARNLPVKEKLSPSFVQLFDAWKAKGGILEPVTQPAPPINQRTSA